MQYLCTIWFLCISLFLFFVSGNFYVVLKEVDGGDCNTEVADTTLHSVNVFPLNVHQFPAAQVLLHSLYGAFVFRRILYMSLFMFFFVCVCDKVQECVSIFGICMHASWDVRVSQREVTHETVALLFFHLLQCSGLSWQGSCGYQSLENKAVRSYWKAERERGRERQGERKKE